MNTKISNLLKGSMDNYILPFFWQHGEDEATLRDYMRAINEAHIGAVCIESRPHPDFVGDKWWRDMDVILDEARKRNMKVWILDDSHFPTGFCNGAVEKANPSLRRMSIVAKTMKTGKTKSFDISGFLKEKGKKAKGNVPADEFVAAVAVPKSDKSLPIIDLTESIRGNLFTWTERSGYELMLIKKSVNYGAHPAYMNMMDPDSVRILIDTVYEPHFAHYADDFGETIAGFFSDEPELGNGSGYENIYLGSDKDFPWSDKLIPELENSLGKDWAAKLALIWCNTADPDETAYVRNAYMQAVSQAVSESFSLQIGDWCREHGVEYIGHILEDNDKHYLTGSSLGHYFRSLYGQDMAGIDDIGGQVYPQGEDKPDKWMGFMKRDGEFYHYTLAKLGQSLAALDPKKHGRCMCEIFGNYGWQEGFKLETYLADHFMVRGINNFVPHAFSAKKYPDPDCPPHFYAQGHNPEYRHFHVLMDYMNRVCSLISGGHHDARLAMLYVGESAWAGEWMMLQKPGRILQDAQIDYDFVPMDAFTDPDLYRTEISEAGNEAGSFRVNTQTYKALLIPHVQYVSKDFASVAEALGRLGVPIYFIGSKPSGIYDEKDKDKAKAALEIIYANSEAVLLENLVEELAAKTPEIKPFKAVPASDRLRYMHYLGTEDLHYIVNEASEAYEGEIRIALDADSAETFYRYDAWTNKLEKLDYRIEKDEPGTDKSTGGDGENVRILVLNARIEPAKSLLVIADPDMTAEEAEALSESFEKQFAACGTTVTMLQEWTRAKVKSINYPNFDKAEKVAIPDVASDKLPRFSGIFRYENCFELKAGENKKVLLKISDAYEGVEVFVNGISAGAQIAAPFEYDLTGLVKEGNNWLAIEVSTTLERERRASLNQGVIEIMQHAKVKQPTGLTGEVTLRI